MKNKPEAFTDDGYIINQPHIDGGRGERRRFRRDGAGIAAYNFLHALGREACWPSLYEALRRSRPGLSPGTSPRRLFRSLRRQDLPGLAKAAGRKRALALLADAPRAGILLYRHKSGLHYVAFRPEGEGTYRFFNAMPGNARHIERMEDFLKTHARAWPVFLIKA